MANLHEITVTVMNPIGLGYVNRLMLIDVDSITTVEETENYAETIVRVGGVTRTIAQPYKDFVHWLNQRVRVNDPNIPQHWKTVASHT